MEERVADLLNLTVNNIPLSDYLDEKFKGSWLSIINGLEEFTKTTQDKYKKEVLLPRRKEEVKKKLKNNKELATVSEETLERMVMELTKDYQPPNFSQSNEYLQFQIEQYNSKDNSKLRDNLSLLKEQTMEYVVKELDEKRSSILNTKTTARDRLIAELEAARKTLKHYEDSENILLANTLIKRLHELQDSIGEYKNSCLTTILNLISLNLYGYIMEKIDLANRKFLDAQIEKINKAKDTDNIAGTIMEVAGKTGLSYFYSDYDFDQEELEQSRPQI